MVRQIFRSVEHFTLNAPTQSMVLPAKLYAIKWHSKYRDPRDDDDIVACTQPFACSIRCRNGFTATPSLFQLYKYENPVALQKNMPFCEQKDLQLLKCNCYTSAFRRLIRNDDCYVRFETSAERADVVLNQCFDGNNTASVARERLITDSIIQAADMRGEPSVYLRYRGKRVMELEFRNCFILFFRDLTCLLVRYVTDSFCFQTRLS